MLRIEQGGKFYYDKELIDSSKVNLKDFIIANLDIETYFGENLNLGDLVHSFYEVREFIYQFFSQEYEVVRAFSTIGKLNKKYKNIKIFKSLAVEESYFYSLPLIELVKIKDDEKAVEKLSVIPLYLEENVSFISPEGWHMNTKTKFTLLDIMRVIFGDLTDVLRKENAIAVQ